MSVGQAIGVVGMTGAGFASAVTYMMQSRGSDIQSGRFVQEYLTEYAVPDIWATQIVDVGRFQRGWGPRTTSDGRDVFHGAVDICGPQGTIVHALRSGLVEHSGQVNGYGEMILMRHSDGSSSLYAHLNDRGVDKGMIIRGGSPIATMGRTSSTGRKPSNTTRQGSIIPGQDTRCAQFPVMGIHLHHSIHGVGPNKLPHAVIGSNAISSPMEHRFGTDPVRFLGRQGIRLFGREIPSCPNWSRTWQTGR